MTSKTQDPRPLLRVSTLAWLVMIMLAGTLTAGWKASEVDRQMRADLLAAAERLVATINPQRLAALSGTEADLGLPEYQRLKRQLQSVQQAFPSYRFIYLMVQRPDRTVIIQVDSEAPGSEDESPPGDVYEEIMPEERPVFDHGIALTTGPTEDRWGVWVSALVPLSMSAGYPGQVALGIDIDARDWRTQVVVRGVLPVALATLALLVIAASGPLLLARRDRLGIGASGSLRLLEQARVLAVGLVLTAVAAWIVHGQTQNNQLRAFELMAEASMQEISAGLHNLRDFGLDALVHFFEASESVSAQEFAHYTDLLARNGLSDNWAWAPRVPASERDAFEQQMRVQGLSDFRIWEVESVLADNQAALDREFLYPVTFETRRSPESSIRGFDLNSQAHVRAALESAQRSGLITTLAPLDATHVPALRGHMLVLQPTRTQLDAGARAGIVMTSVAFDELLSTWAGNDTLAMELWLLHEDGLRQPLARSGVTGISRTAPRVLEQPVLVFGETFLIRVATDRGFASAQRSLVAAGTAFAGILLTMMLAVVVGLVTRQRENLEQAVRERTIALQEFRAAVEQSTEGIALTDLNGTVRFVNRAWAEMHGYRSTEVSGKHLSTFHTPDQMARVVIPGLDELMEKGFAVGEGDHLHRNGSAFPTRMSASLISNDQGEPFGILRIAQDISEERQQREREQFNQRFRALVASIAAGFVSAPDDASIERKIDRALASLGVLFEVDRAYLFQLSNDLASAKNTHEWCAPGIEGQKELLQSVSLSDKGWWMEHWRQKRPVRIENVGQMPPDAATEQVFLQAQSICSLVCLPMFDENTRLLGFIGFDSVRSIRRWPKEQVGMLQVVADILAGALRRRAVLQALAESESRFRDLAEESRSFRWQVDLDGLYTDLDPLVSDILEYRPDELVGKKHFYDLAPEADREIIRREGLQRIRSATRCNGYENRVMTRDGRMLWVSSTILPLFHEDGRLLGVRGSDTDITERKQAELQLEHLAHHDLLTDLPNRVLLADRLQQAMAQSERGKDMLGVAYLDLDAFKPINDRFGHEVGDRLLVTVAKRVQQILREGDTVARLGGDEFALVLIGLPDVESCRPLLQRLLDGVAEPIEHDGQRLQVSVSLGISFFPQSETIDADQLLRQADQAMYQAKLAGKNRYHLFDAAQDRRLRDNHQHIERLRQGLLDDEFVLHYQPKVNMRSGEVIGFEALIRWAHPERGLLPPGAFLPLLEKHRLMIELGDWVIDQVLAQISRWRDAGIALPVSLNVDPLQLAQAGFIEGLETELASYPAVRPGDLELEVLETSALDEAVAMVDIIRAGNALGVEFALDDFGTGYSSLSYLKRLPVATLKIDRSFVHDMLQDPDDLAILQGVISLARTFRQTVIAEGVETEAHGEMLLQLGCHIGQGYAIARPMPAEDVPGWLAQWRSPDSWLHVETLDAQRLPFLTAVVEYRAWVAGLRSVLCVSGTHQAKLDPPAVEFMEWLDADSAVEASTGKRIRELHQRLRSLGVALWHEHQAGAGGVQPDRFAAIESVCADLIAALGAATGRLARNPGTLQP